MQVLIESRDRDAVGQREAAVRRLRFALRRLAWLIARATVRYSDDNGPRGGIDKRCRLELHTTDGHVIVANSVAADSRQAFERALARAARALARLRARLRSSGRDRAARFAQLQHDGSQP